MQTLIFLDDERNPSDVYWVNYPEYKEIVVVRTATEFYSTLAQFGKNIQHFDFSFDHDLADFDTIFGERTGYDCAKLLIAYHMELDIDPTNLVWYVHSQNPIGAKNISSYIQGYVDFYNKGR